MVAGIWTTTSFRSSNASAQSRSQLLWRSSPALTRTIILERPLGGCEPLKGIFEAVQHFTQLMHVYDSGFPVRYHEAYAKLRLLLVRGSMSEVFRNLATRRLD